MLYKVNFKKDYRCFKKGDRIDFRPGINLLVGDQGCGKSTLIQVLREGKNDTISMKFDPIKMLSKDFEKESPRTISYFGQSGGLEGLEIASKFMSHGQTSLIFLRALKQIKEPTLLLVDEPDMALSPRSAYELVDLFQHVAKTGQVVASIHNPLVMESVDEVYSLEHRKWMTPAKFLEEQKKPLVEK